MSQKLLLLLAPALAPPFSDASFGVLPLCLFGELLRLLSEKITASSSFFFSVVVKEISFLNRTSEERKGKEVMARNFSLSGR